MHDPTLFDDAYILTGPTASGKSHVALLLAERLGAEIVCMDSMTIYRGIDIGTAKPSSEDRQRVPHHLIDLLNPSEGASVAWWLDRAAEVVQDLDQRGKPALFVGGTPLYLKALLCGLFAQPDVDPALRHELESLPRETLMDRLRAVDPAAAQRIHINDQRRLVRALEIFTLTQQAISEQQKQFDSIRPRRHRPVWLDWPRPLLHQRINARVDRMLAGGWLEEVRRLLGMAKPMSKEARQAAGYRELAEYLAGTLSWEDAINRTKARSRQLAKRQVTWFRHLPGVQALAVTGSETMEQIANACALAWQHPMA